MKKILLSIIIISNISYSQDTNSVRKLIRNDWSNIFAITTAAPLTTILFMKKNRGIPLAISGATIAMSLSYSDNKKVYLRNAMFAISGMLDAFSRELIYHNDMVFEKMPYLSKRFFGTDSWKNKYNANYPFATTLLVSTTDGDHASRALNKVFVIGGMITLDYKLKSFKQHLSQILIGSVIYISAKGCTHYYFQN